MCVAPTEILKIQKLLKMSYEDDSKVLLDSSPKPVLRQQESTAYAPQSSREINQQGSMADDARAVRPPSDHVYVPLKFFKRCGRRKEKATWRVTTGFPFLMFCCNSVGHFVN